MTLPIQTERLLLRQFTYDDVEDILMLVSYPSIAQAMPEITPTHAGAMQYVATQNDYQPFERDKCFDLAVEQKANGRVIGVVTLVTKAHRQAEIGYAVGTPYRRRGVATEAAHALVAYGFTHLGLHRIQAKANASNAASWRVMERLGMRREAHLHEATLRDGAWEDVLIYALLENEFAAAPRLSRNAP